MAPSYEGATVFLIIISKLAQFKLATLNKILFALFADMFIIRLRMTELYQFFLNNDDRFFVFADHLDRDYCIFLTRFDPFSCLFRVRVKNNIDRYGVPAISSLKVKSALAKPASQIIVFDIIFSSDGSRGKFYDGLKELHLLKVCRYTDL